MKTSTYTTRVLEPSEGCKLTQSADVALQDRIISDKVFLAANASPEDWREITDAEAEEIEKEKERVNED